MGSLASAQREGGTSSMIQLISTVIYYGGNPYVVA
jgi:hypothetical protein